MSTCFHVLPKWLERDQKCVTGTCHRFNHRFKPCTLSMKKGMPHYRTRSGFGTGLCFKRSTLMNLTRQKSHAITGRTQLPNKVNSLLTIVGRCRRRSSISFLFFPNCQNIHIYNLSYKSVNLALLLKTKSVENQTIF